MLRDLYKPGLKSTRGCPPLRSMKSQVPNKKHCLFEMRLIKYGFQFSEVVGFPQFNTIPCGVENEGEKE